MRGNIKQARVAKPTISPSLGARGLSLLSSSSKTRNESTYDTQEGNKGVAGGLDLVIAPLKVGLAAHQDPVGFLDLFLRHGSEGLLMMLVDRRATIQRARDFVGEGNYITSCWQGREEGGRELGRKRRSTTT
jgi:hypothetical protein